MRPSAQFRSAQEILDTLVSSEMSLKVLINWGRQNRFAGSKDRRKIRDIVYYCLRNKRYLLHRWNNKDGGGGGGITQAALIRKAIGRRGWRSMVANVRSDTALQ